jgi:8-oxo-dGTP pyrophosphatase MutT (NUDIX family)
MRVEMDAVRQAFGSGRTNAFDAVPVGRHAVVAAILRDSPQGAEVLLIRRAEHELDPWSGHMALPGGHADAGDDSLVATAVREISEEVGLDLLEHAELLGRLPEMLAVPRQLAIHPLVFALETGHEPLANPAEVQEVVWSALAHLRSPKAQISHELSTPQQRYRFPAFDVGGRVVWGLTYRILGELLDTLDRPERAGSEGAKP